MNNNIKRPQFPLSFTGKYNGQSNVLKSDVRIMPASNGAPAQMVPTITYSGLWDTGASKSAITKKVADELGLQPISFCRVATPQGEYNAPCYYVSVFLPNNVVIPNLLVTGAENGNPNWDILIGMDIIGLGDFCVSNYNGKTVFTYRIPSSQEIDFVVNTYGAPSIKTEKSIGRNSRCPCGSGKKYKNCHGSI